MTLDHHTAVGDFQTLVVLRTEHLRSAPDGDVPPEKLKQYRRGVRQFKGRCMGPGVRVAIFGDSGSGAFVTSERASFLVQEREIRFDWTAAQRLLHRADAIADQAAEWWPRIDLDDSSSRQDRRQSEANDLERRPHVDRAYNLLTAVLSAINQENLRVGEIETGATDADVHSSAYMASIKVIAGDIERAEALLETAAQRRAQLTYTLQRMTSGSLRLDVNAGAGMLFRFGALRPAIGAILGMAVFVFFAGGLLPAVSVTPSQELAFYAAVGFLAGFNERFAQDMIASSGHRLTS